MILLVPLLLHVSLSGEGKFLAGFKYVIGVWDVGEHPEHKMGTEAVRIDSFKFG